MTWDILEGDCVGVMAGLEPASVDAVVTDPPYELGFMGKAWDRSGVAYQVGTWTEALRVLKPGGHLLAFGGTRTYHRLACALEDAGFEIRDCLAWLYGSGFPKSLDVSKAIDKAERGVPQGAPDPTSPNHGRYKSGCSDENPSGRGFGAGPGAFMRPVTQDDIASERTAQQNGAAPADAQLKSTRAATANDGGLSEGPLLPSQEARNGGGPSENWEGWGTALKPAHEPIVLARKPLVGTVAGNVLAHGTGAINVDGCRIGRQEGDRTEYGLENGAEAGIGYHGLDGRTPFDGSAGRWPANVVLDEHAAALLDKQTGERGSFLPAGTVRPNSTSPTIFGVAGRPDVFSYGDSGGASRFFYVAKASRAERNAGLEGFEERDARGYQPMTQECGECGNRTVGPGGLTCGHDSQTFTEPNGGRARNHHPTVKPVGLMRWLVRLVTPPGGVVLDPFAGSGTTGVAAVLEGFRFLGVEREPEYVELARARIGWWLEHGEEALRIVREREARDAERAATLESGQLELGVG